MDPQLAPVVEPAEHPAPKPYDDRLARLLVLPLTFVFVTLVLTFFVFYASYEVVGPSMLPTLRTSERLLVQRGYKHPLRGDIVIVEAGDRRGQDDLVKRVVAVAGDRVSTIGDIAVVNGVRESGQGLITGDMDQSMAEIVVPQGTVFVMGDNRAVSLDSRYIGPIPLGRIFGRAVAVYAPITRVRGLGRTTAR